MKKALIPISVFLLLVLSANFIISKTQLLETIKGWEPGSNWTVSEVVIETTPGNDDALSVETSLFGELYLNKGAFTVAENGQASFVSNGATVITRFVLDGDIMRIYFNSGTPKKNGMVQENTESYSDYSYTPSSQGVVLQREDAVVKETYTLIRK